MACVGFFVFKRFDGRLHGVKEREEILKIYQEKKEENFVKDLREKYKNEDIKGFLVVTETNIAYPIAYSGDNSFYLTHGYDKKYSINGSLFFDKDCENDKLNTIVYGHRMSMGTMFNQLPKLLNEEKAKKAQIMLYDSYGDVRNFKILAIFRVPSDYDYRKVDFANVEDLRLYADNLKDVSEIDFNVDSNKVNEILTLSTCTYEKKDYRLVVVAYR